MFFIVRENNTSIVYNVSKCYAHPTRDVAILELEKLLPFSVKIENLKLENGDIFYGVGYGVGAKDFEKSPDYNKSPPIFESYDGKKKVFKNRMILDKDLLSFDLSKKETLCDEYGAVEGEGMVGPGDSGGGVFVKKDNSIILVGVLESISIGHDSDGDSITIGYAVLVNDECIKWIDSIVNK